MQEAKKSLQAKEKKWREYNIEATKQTSDNQKELTKRSQEAKDLVVKLNEKERQLRERERELNEERRKLKMSEDEIERKNVELNELEERLFEALKQNEEMEERLENKKGETESPDGSSANLEATETEVKVEEEKRGIEGSRDIPLDSLHASGQTQSPRTQSMVAPISLSSGSHEPIRTPTEKRALKRRHVLAEIVSTEVTYVATLQIVVDVTIPSSSISFFSSLNKFLYPAGILGTFKRR